MLITFCMTTVNANNSNEAELFVENFTNNIFKTITDTNISNEEVAVLLSSEIKQNIDFNYICKFIIGRYWRNADSNFKSSFRELYESFLINTYAPQFKGYNGESYKIIKTKEIRPNRFSTNIVFITEHKTQLNVIIYFIRNKQNQFKIVDITGEGISLIASQREEFGSIISNYGLDYFLTSFKDRVTKLQNNS
ncbi:MAG: ABC transporter substrate-binding protein [Rickettsiales bacterium]|nr:ABC transporter substrate-binding protein [Rickettsiales bacterium]